MNKVYFEDINVGDSIPAMVKHPTPRQLVQWAGASGEFYEIHYDQNFAREKGLSGIIVHGMLMVSFLGQMLIDWAGDSNALKKIRTSNRAMVFPGQDITCKGVIVKKYSENGENKLDCDIWLETEKGEKSVTGNATLSLPSRS